METNSPLVTVIMPCYNAEKLIAESIDSVVAQTYPNWELIVVDDCSSDSSSEIVKAYTEKDKRIKYLKSEKPSGGPSVPRNIGIENAKGEYVAFLDSDDLWLPQKLGRQLEYMRNNGFDFVYSYYEKMSADGTRDNRIVRTKLKSDYSSILKSNSIPCLTSLLKRDLIGDIRFKEIPQEDFCFWLDVLRNGAKAYNMAEVTALYRETPNSRSRNKLDMFRGYWNVIRNEQKISPVRAAYCMLTYSINGFKKYIK